MKQRIGFVSNSSSTSFLIAVKFEYNLDIAESKPVNTVLLNSLQKSAWSNSYQFYDTLEVALTEYCRRWYFQDLIKIPDLSKSFELEDYKYVILEVGNSYDEDDQLDYIKYFDIGEEYQSNMGSIVLVIKEAQ